MKPGPIITPLTHEQIRLSPFANAMLRHFDGEPPLPTPPAIPPVPPQQQQTPPPAPRPPVHTPEPPRSSDNIADVRAEAAGYRIEARTAREQLAVAEAARVAAENAANQRVADAEARAATTANRIKERTRDAELRAAATAAGIRDADLIPLIDARTITVDDDGIVTGAAEAVAAFKVKKPEYFAAAQQQPAPPPRITGAPGNPPAPGPAPTPNSVQAIPRDRAGRLEYEGQKTAALKALR